MRALVAKVLQWTGIVGDAFGLITIIGIGVAGMTAAAATLVQVVEELALGPQIVFLIAAFVFTWAIVVAMLRPVPRIFSRLSNRYRWLRLPRWLRDDAPLLTNTQHQQLLWLERLLAPEQAQPASRIRLGPPKSDWSHFNDDLAYFDIVLPVTNASIHRVAIQIPLATGNLSWQGAPLAVPPILDSIDRRSDSSISILPGDTIEMTLRQRLQPDEVKAIRESMLQADAVVGIDFSSYRLPFTLEPLAAISSAISGLLPLPLKLAAAFPFEAAYPKYSVDQKRSYISLRTKGHMDSAFVCLVLDEKNPFELPIRALKASVELPSPGTSSTGIAEINELGVATSGFGFQRYGEADFEGTQIARNLLDETWWANTYVELFLSDGNSVRKLEQVLFTPSWSRLERAGT